MLDLYNDNSHNIHNRTLYNEQADYSRNESQNMKQLCISTLNIQGLSKYENDVQLKEFVSKFDIIGFCETWGEHSTDFSEFFEGYCSFSKVRPKRRNAIRGSGGINVFVKEALISENLLDVFVLI